MKKSFLKKIEPIINKIAIINEIDEKDYFVPRRLFWEDLITENEDGTYSKPDSSEEKINSAPFPF